jgi:hypothetical protein
MMVMSLLRVISLSSGHISFFTRWVILQKRNKIQAALIRALMVLTIRATWLGSLVNWLNKLAVSIKKGAPGGWPTSSL